MPIKIQKVVYTRDGGLITVLLKRDAVVAPGDDAGDYGSLDVAVAKTATRADCVTAIKQAMAAYMSGRSRAASLAQGVEDDLASVGVV